MRGILKLISLVAILTAFILPMVINTIRMENSYDKNGFLNYRPVDYRIPAVVIIIAFVLLIIS